MTDTEPDFGKQAKDIAEAANTSVEAVTKLASFLDGTFGNAITNAFGILGDKLAYCRLSKAVELQEAVERKLEARGGKKALCPSGIRVANSRKGLC